VSAGPSLPIPFRDVCNGPAPAGPDCVPADPWGPDLLVALSRVPDPRDSRGVRHRLVTVLAAAVCAVLAGARSLWVPSSSSTAVTCGIARRLAVGMIAGRGGRSVPDCRQLVRFQLPLTRDGRAKARCGWAGWALRPAPVDVPALTSPKIRLPARTLGEVIGSAQR
jgi:DDE_Tnp_1-associated